MSKSLRQIHIEGLVAKKAHLDRSLNMCLRDAANRIQTALNALENDGELDEHLIHSLGEISREITQRNMLMQSLPYLTSEP